MIEVLYHIADNRFIVRKNNQYFFVILKKSLIDEITKEDVESILRQGYWQTDYDGEKREAIASLMSSI